MSEVGKFCKIVENTLARGAPPLLQQVRRLISANPALFSIQKSKRGRRTPRDRIRGLAQACLTSRTIATVSDRRLSHSSLLKSTTREIMMQTWTNECSKPGLTLLL